MSRWLLFLEIQVLKINRGASWQVQKETDQLSDQTWCKQKENLFAQANITLGKDQKQ